MSRTEHILVVQPAGSAEPITVEVPEDAEVRIPTIPGANNVSQLRHRLDVQRMSKSRGNVVNPDLLVDRFGADTVRTYLMFAFEWEKGGPWDSRGIRGAQRFIADIWRLGQTSTAPESSTRQLPRPSGGALTRRSSRSGTTSNLSVGTPRSPNS